MEPDLDDYGISIGGVPIKEKAGESINLENYREVLDKLDRLGNPMISLRPYMLPIILSILSLALLQWPRLDLMQRLGSLTIMGACLAIHRLAYPLASLSVAVAFATWICLPGSLASLDLPDHGHFMRKLQLLPPNDEGENEECMVCWDNEHPVAQLPCKHRSCKRCLHLMAQHFQTACPLCHKAFFSIHDRKIFMLTKWSVALATSNFTLLLLQGIKNVVTGAYWSAFAAVWVLVLNGGHFWVVTRSIQDSGAEWWRSSPAKQSIQLRWVDFNCVMNTFNVCLTLYNLDDFFD